MEKLKLAFPTAFSELVECFGEKQAEIELEKLVERQKINPKLDLEDKPLLAAFVWEETEQGHEYWRELLYSKDLLPPLFYFLSDSSHTDDE
ncbi:hypothetical protein PR1_12 [Providencia phage vB_PreS_PR1]|uniref:Uncharacterized protein n=1 Tax=Providencia phage vB_PreS_PR1 TaxID=1931407 RepID=A0A1S6KV62_9CAUD|nr:hypothetical protein FDH30_gp012 [Providencia phage vB_PreS_PR1]AQT25327.1 hypothetical protein PR1_12 [Providencia phage vB_PreS_PR1]